MADEEKKGEKQIVLPYDEYKRMVRLIADNKMELKVSLTNKSSYPSVTLENIVYCGNNAQELGDTIRSVFSEISNKQAWLVWNLQQKLSKANGEIYRLQQNQSHESRLSRDLSEEVNKNCQLRKTIGEMRRENKEWKGIATCVSFIGILVIILLLIFR